MIPAIVFEFLTDLAAHNDKEWFQQNKSYFQKARKAFESCLSEMIERVKLVDPSVGNPSASECLFRIYRDVRFSHDKRPYKQNFGGYVAFGGRKSELPGYYLQVEPGNSFFGGGLYCPQPPVLKKVRDEVSVYPEELRAILESADFTSTFGSLWDDQLKTAPKGFARDHKAIDLIRYKSYTALVSFSDAQCTEVSFNARVEEAIRRLYPLNQFLLRAIEAPQEENVNW